MEMPFKKGDERINRRGRPKNSKNKRNPNEKLQRALQNGWDMRDLKEMAKEIISEEGDKYTAAQRSQLLKTLFDVELKLMELDMKHNKDEKEAGTNPSQSSSQDDDDTDSEESGLFKIS